MAECEANHDENSENSQNDTKHDTLQASYRTNVEPKKTKTSRALLPAGIYPGFFYIRKCTRNYQHNSERTCLYSLDAGSAPEGSPPAGILDSLPCAAPSSLTIQACC